MKGLTAQKALFFCAAGACLLALLWLAGGRLRSGLAGVRAELSQAEADLAVSMEATARLRETNELRARDIENYKKTLSAMAGSKKNAYQAGLSLQEEKRLLEKQLEIMKTWLEISEEDGKIRLMRGDQSLKDFKFSAPVRLYASAVPMPGSTRVVSKERFANPERGKVEQKDGQLTWEPPQVGSDPRSGALGEYVIFTDGPLILHGPPPGKKLHEAYPHTCANLTAAAAKRLYDSTFVGTRILYRKARKTAVPPTAKK